MTTHDLEELAVRLEAALTPTQRKALHSLSEQPQDKSVSWSIKVGYRLERMGLAKRTLLSDRTYLTELGLKVRARSKAQSPSQEGKKA